MKIICIWDIYTYLSNNVHCVPNLNLSSNISYTKLVSIKYGQQKDLIHTKNRSVAIITEQEIDLVSNVLTH